MIKLPITYTNQDKQKVTEDHYFNLSRVEYIELELEHKEGLEAAIKAIAKAEDNKSLFAEVKKIVLMTYGRREKVDGLDTFMKKDPATQIPYWTAFEGTLAFDQLMIDLLSNEDVTVNFINGVLPPGVAGDLTKEQMKAKGEEIVSGALNDTGSDEPKREMTTAEIAAAKAAEAG